MPVKQRRCAAAVLTAAGLVLSGCSVQEELSGAGKAPVAIGIDATSNEQVVLGEIYSRILQGQGRPTSVTDVPYRDGADAIGILKERPVDFLVTCTGQLLEEENTAAATTLAGEQKDVPPVEFTDRVYDAAVATLPGDIRTVDPSPAQGCGAVKHAHKELPQNIIPLFSKAMFDRSEIQRVNFMTRVMSTEDLHKMAAELEAGEDLQAVVADWLLEYAQIDVYANDPVEDADPVDPDSASG